MTKLYMQRRDTHSYNRDGSRQERPDVQYTLYRTDTPELLTVDRTDAAARAHRDDAYLFGFCAIETKKVLGLKAGELPPRGRVITYLDRHDYDENGTFIEDIEEDQKPIACIETVGAPVEVKSIKIKFAPTEAMRLAARARRSK